MLGRTTERDMEMESNAMSRCVLLCALTLFNHVTRKHNWFLQCAAIRKLIIKVENCCFNTRHLLNVATVYVSVVSCVRHLSICGLWVAKSALYDTNVWYYRFDAICKPRYALSTKIIMGQLREKPSTFPCSCYGSAASNEIPSKQSTGEINKFYRESARAASKQ